jgi:4-hydroxy-2-oxoglutarate aldolase
LLRVWEWVAQYAAPEKLLIAFTGRTSVRETVDLSNRVAKLGYKAAWAYDPNTVYVSSVADQIAIPLLLPWHAVPKVEHPNAFPQAVAVSSSNLAKAFADGATAAFSEFANAAPYAAISIWEAHRTREYEAALDWQNRIAQAVHLVEGQYGIAGLKYAMDLNGYYGGPPRLPLIGLTPAAKKEIEQAFDGLRG